MFDPYHKWLGIPREEQPPNHYRLLGLSLFENDPEVIDAAANRQMAYLQGCATGTQALLSQRLLNELAASRLCLLTPEKKAIYDARLTTKLSVGSEIRTPEPSSPAVRSPASLPAAQRRVTSKRFPVVEGLDSDVEPDEILPLSPIMRRHRGYRKKKFNLPVIASTVIMLTVGSVGVVLLLNKRPKTSKEFVEKSNKIDRSRTWLPGDSAVMRPAKINELSQDSGSTDHAEHGHVLQLAPELTAWDNTAPPGEVHRFTGHGKAVSCVIFTSDGKLAVSGSEDATVCIWDGIKKIRRFTTSLPVHCLALSRDDRFLATGLRKGDIVVWDFKSGERIRTLKGHSFWTNGLAFTGDGTTLFSSSGHSDDPTTRLWDVGTSTEVRQIRLFGPLAISPSGTSVLIGEFKTPVLWNHSLESSIRRFKGHRSLIQSVAFSPDGDSVISGSGWDVDNQGFFAGTDNSVRLWSASTGRERRRFIGHENWVYSVAFSPDGRWILSGGGGTIEGHNNWRSGTDMSLRLWDADSGREVHRFTGHNQPVKSVAFSPDGKFALSGSEDGTARVWRLPKPPLLSMRASVRGEVESPIQTPVESGRKPTGEISLFNGKNSPRTEPPVPPIGKWVEQRPGTQVGDRVRTFQPDGTFVLGISKQGKTVTGTWRRDGQRIYFSLPATEGSEPPTKDKWFTISGATSKEMTIHMLGERRYVWYRSS